MSDGSGGPGDGGGPPGGVGAARDQPEPLLPDWDGAVPPSCGARPCSASWRTRASAALPPWFPAPVAGASQIVLLVIDGLGAEQLRERSALAPVADGGHGRVDHLGRPEHHGVRPDHAGHGQGAGRARRGGLPGGPRRRGDERPAVVASRGVDARDAGARHRCSSRARPSPARRARCRWSPATTTGRRASPPRTWATSTLHRWHTPAGLVTAVRELAAAGSPFVYAYYEGIDKVAHAEGLGQYYDDELRAVDRLVGDVLDVLPPGCGAGRHRRSRPGGGRRLGRGARSGDHAGRDPDQRRRTVSLAARPARGAARTSPRRRRPSHGEVAWVRTKEQIIEDGWLGGVPSAEVAARLGDVALVPVRPDGVPRPGRHR